MIHHSYQYLIFILPIKLFEFNHTIHQPRQYHQHNKSPISTLKNNKNKITITLDNDYHFYLYHNHDKYVTIEAQQIIQNHIFDTDYSGLLLPPKQKLLLNQATERLEFYGDIDKDMIHFNEMLFILHQIEQSFDVVILNTAQTKYLNKTPLRNSKWGLHGIRIKNPHVHLLLHHIE